MRWRFSQESISTTVCATASRMRSEMCRRAKSAARAAVRIVFWMHRGISCVSSVPTPKCMRSCCAALQRMKTNSIIWKLFCKFSIEQEHKTALCEQDGLIAEKAIYCERLRCQRAFGTKSPKHGPLLFGRTVMVISPWEIRFSTAGHYPNLCIYPTNSAVFCDIYIL